MVERVRSQPAAQRPNILLITSDEERHTLPHPGGFELETLIDAEIGNDERVWVTERPRLVGWPTWRGDVA